MSSLTSRERMLVAMANGVPDRVPVAPDMSNMIPCRLTGKPFWDIYLYQDPPLWRAYIEAVNYFGADGWIWSLEDFHVPDPDAPAPDPEEHTETVIVERTPRRIVTRRFLQRPGQVREWSPHVTVYPVDDPPSCVLAGKVGMAAPPDKWERIEGVKQQKQGFELLQEALDYFGDRGVIGALVAPPQLVGPDRGFGYSVYDYYDRYDEVKAWAEDLHQQQIAYLRRILSGPVRPDFILTGGSGMLVFGTPQIIRDLSLPALQDLTRLCQEEGLPSQVHCCGPERELVKMCAEETDLSSINPLEIPPMGDCDLAEIKQSFGAKLGLMGNLHTTKVMLRGSVKDVRRESLKALLAAGENGGFVLSTGDQCGRDTPDENLRAMVEVAEEFGVYPLDFGRLEREIRRLD